MAIKLVDELKAMGNFPIAHAEGINLVKTDGTEDNLQNLFDNGELGGGDSSTVLTQEEYEALSEEQKLDGLYYTYDTKRIYKNGVQYGASEPIPLTMEEYKALKEAGAIDEQQEYLIEANEQGILLGAEDIGYNNAESGIQATTVQGAIDKVNGKVEELNDSLVDIERLTDFDEAIPEKGKNKIYYVNKVIDTYSCAQWRVESMYYDVSGIKQYRGVQKATSINGIDNIMLIREYYLDDNNVMRWNAWKEIATMDKVADSIIRESRSVLYNLNNVDNIEVAIDIAKSGYKPIAVSLFNSGTHLWFAQGMYFNDTVCNLSLRGVTPSSATNAECKVLVTYIKTS